MRRLKSVALVALVLAAVAFVHQPSRAIAGVGWCEDDPIVQINGTTISALIGVFDDAALVGQDVDVAETTFFVPKGVKTQKLGTTSVYFREKVSFVESDTGWSDGQPVAVTVVVTFSSGKILPAHLTVVSSSRTFGASAGTTASGMSVSFVLK